MIARAIGAKTKQIQLSWYAASRNKRAAPMVRAAASQTFTVPRGNSHPAVRGLSASKCLSAKRLKPIAAVRAATIATRIQESAGNVTGCFGQANASEDIAKGSANTVCEKRTRRP